MFKFDCLNDDILDIIYEQLNLENLVAICWNKKGINVINKRVEHLQNDICSLYKDMINYSEVGGLYECKIMGPLIDKYYLVERRHFGGLLGQVSYGLGPYQYDVLNESYQNASKNGNEKVCKYLKSIDKHGLISEHKK